MSASLSAAQKRPDIAAEQPSARPASDDVARRDALRGSLPAPDVASLVAPTLPSRPVAPTSVIDSLMVNVSREVPPAADNARYATRVYAEMQKLLEPTA